MPQPGSPVQRRNGAAAAQEGGGWPLGAQLLGAPGLLAAQQLLIRGLFKRETELLTVEVRFQPRSWQCALQLLSDLLPCYSPCVQDTRSLARRAGMHVATRGCCHPGPNVNTSCTDAMSVDECHVSVTPATLSAGWAAARR